MLFTVSEIAERFTIPEQTIYSWLRVGKVSSVKLFAKKDKRAGVRLLDDQEVRAHIESGNRKPRQALPVCDDSRTTVKTGNRFDHRWFDESGQSVTDEHPFAR